MTAVLKLIGLSLILVFLFTVDTHGQNRGSTDWVPHNGQVRTRLVAATRELASDTAMLFAFEAELADGWKIYWRSPGDAGLPTRVFVEGARMDELYPLPKKFTLFNLETYGYGDIFSLPFYVDNNALADGSAAMLVDYMVCKDICVPYEDVFTITAEMRDAASFATDIRLKNWLKKVPDTKGDGGAALAIKDTSVMGRVNYQRVQVKVNVPEGFDTPMILVEADNFQMGDPIQRPGPTADELVFIVPLYPRDKGTDLTGLPLRITLSDGRGHAIDRLVTPQ